jgi:hypothetical protein
MLVRSDILLVKSQFGISDAESHGPSKPESSFNEVREAVSDGPRVAGAITQVLAGDGLEVRPRRDPGSP